MARGMCQFDVTTISELKLCCARPAFGFERVAEGIERRTVEVDAAGEILRIKRREARDFACAGGAVHAGDQQPFAVFGGQQFDRVGNARGSAGKHHDAVGLAIERYLVAGNLRRRTSRNRLPAAEHR